MKVYESVWVSEKTTREEYARLTDGWEDVLGYDWAQANRARLEADKLCVPVVRNV